MDDEQIVYVVDDDEGVREGLQLLLETVGQRCELFESAVDFLAAFDLQLRGCLILDIRMSKMTGLDLQLELNRRGATLPIIFITGHGDVPMAVEAMRQGALDFIRKPFREQDLLDRINEALEADAGHRQAMSERVVLMGLVESLTRREKEVFDCVSGGDMNKVIASNLGISERTVEVHRAQVMKKLGVRTLAQLVRIKLEFEKSG